MQTIRPDQEFQRFLAEGRFMLQRSRASGRHVFPPRVAEPGSGAQDLEWIEASGLGTLYSLTVVSQKAPASDYNIALVELAEGPRILTRLEGMPQLVPIGSTVRARIVIEKNQPLLVFAPAGASA